ncbi:MAG: Voltage-gated potassium channel [Betaproteobacteria bacterium]|nr:Voltage-gated potassium channel [Betaproteobacteria bacterium]
MQYAASSPDPIDTSPEVVRFGRPPSGWRRRLFKIVFESDTPAGRAFDIVLVFVILASVLVVFLDSVEHMSARYGRAFDALEWMFTVLFTVEYLARILSVERPLRYATSFFGIVDLLSVLPTYLAVISPEMQSLIDIRTLRLLRLFRILKLTAYLAEMRGLTDALVASRRKIVVFLATVFTIVVLLGTVMYVVEGPKNGFTSIPISVYWAISTLTTVGFGDIVPKTDIGRLIASFMMLLGWGILAVPTGIVTAEMTHRRFADAMGKLFCPACGSTKHSSDAKFCQDCGAKLENA